MLVQQHLAEFVAREAIAQPYRQTQVMNTREYATWLRDRGINLSWQTLCDLWRIGVLHPVAVLQPALEDQGEDRFGTVDLGYPISSFVDLGRHVESAQLPHVSLDVPAARADALLWHPFQLYSFCWLHRALDLHVMVEAPLQGPDVFAELARGSAERLLEHVKEVANSPDHLKFIQVLAVLLAAEPLVHGMIDSRVVTHPLAGESFDGYFEWRGAYDGPAILDRVGITAEDLEQWHHKISVEAQMGDPLESWRPLIRHASRDKRAKLKADALRADNLYDAAEILRRYLELYHDRTLPEEDDAIHGPQSQTVKERLFGSSRTADFERTVFRRIVRSFDLDPQARTTWFVEGETEEGFNETTADRLHLDLTRAGVEVMNLNGLGGLHSDRLRALLERFQREQVFAYVTIDFDKNDDNPRLLKHYASLGLLAAGYRVWEPDFEVANFTFEELAAVAMEMASDGGVSVTMTGEEIKGEMERSAVAAGTAIKRIWSRQKFYGGKGEEWGHHLADWAMKHTCPSELTEGGERPAIGRLYYVLRGQTSNYSSTIESSDVDDRGSLVPKRQAERREPPEAWRC